MVKSGEKRPLKARLSKWLDEWKLSGMGAVLATRYPSFWVVFILVFVIFGTAISLLAGGTGAFSLLIHADWEFKFKILGDGFLGLFGVNKNFLDFLLVFLIAVLQGLLISLIVLVWRKRPKQNKGGISDAGIVAGLAVLGSGCPTCGTALITPLVGAIFSSSSYAIAGAISGIITAIAIIVAIFSLKKVGLDCYAIIKDEEWMKKHGKSN